MTMRPRRAASCALVALALLSGATACSQTKDDSGAVTNLEDVGPQIARLRAQVDALEQQVRTLQEQVAVLDPALASTTTTTAPLR